MRDLLSKLDAIVSETELKNPEDLQAKRKALADLEKDPVAGKDPEIKQAIMQRKADLEKEAKSKGFSESFEVGDEFGISFSEDHEIATTIVDILEDGIVIELDDTALDMLTNEGLNFLEGELVEDKQKGVDGKACWKGYKRMGTKQKGGKTVDNCVKMEDHGPENPDAPVNYGEYDREGDMAKDDLRTIDDAAEELYSILQADDNLPEWVQSKITKAVDYIDTARDYMKAQKYEEGVAEGYVDRNGPIENTPQVVWWRKTQGGNNIYWKVFPSLSTASRARENLANSLYKKYGKNFTIGNAKFDPLDPAQCRAADADRYMTKKPGMTEGSTHGTTNESSWSTNPLNPMSPFSPMNPISPMNPENFNHLSGIGVVIGSGLAAYSIALAQAFKDLFQHPETAAMGEIKKVQSQIRELYKKTKTLKTDQGRAKAQQDLTAAYEVLEQLKARVHSGLAEGDVDEAKYQGREVPLGKKMAGDVKKSKVYVRKPNGNIVKVNFGDKKMRIKKSNPARRKSFRARHNCANPGPRHKARYWSCRSW